MEGSRVKVVCVGQGFPLNVSQRWFFNGVSVLATPTLKQRTQTSSDGSLVIGSIDKKDSGWYKCSPSNGIGRAPEAQAYINVTYLPRVVNVQPKLYLARNLHGRISCRVDANPPMSLIRWYKDNRPIDLSTQKHIQLSADSTHLYIGPATDKDEGNYYCVPYSSLGQGEKSSTMQVLVRG